VRREARVAALTQVTVAFALESETEGAAPCAKHHATLADSARVPFGLFLHVMAEISTSARAFDHELESGMLQRALS
jgi:hypothetical protein